MTLLRLIACLIIPLTLSVRAFAACDTVISLITAYPGTDIYELEGHSAIRVKIGPDRDYAVSYGMFNFNAPNFVYRFVKGETDYMVGTVPFPYFLEEYRRQGRRVEELSLNLTDAEKDRALSVITENLKPENRVYRYNYVKDNCSTRPFSVIQRAVGDSLRTADDLSQLQSEYGSTFRDVMRHYHRRYPWYQFGIDLALGSGIDYPLQPYEYAFVPMIMADQAASAEVGARRVGGEVTVLSDFAPEAALSDATPWYLSPLFVCWVVFALLLVTTIHDLRCKRVTRWVDAVYFGILGLAGLLLTFLIFVSVHEATSPNWLYFWLNPFCLIPTIFIWLKKCNKLVLSYQIANFAVVIISLAVWPWIPQSANAAFLPLVLGDLLRAANYIYINIRRLK